jgi:hypothetical protein
MKQETPKTFKELFANTGIEPITNENGNIQYNFKATIKEKPKQETLEEVAQWVINNRYAKSELEKVSDFEMYNTIIDKCSKWQAERMYSEEEVVSFIHRFIKEHQPQLPYLIGGINMWFGQFKKK